MSEDLEDVIAARALKAASMSSDAGKVEQTSVNELIAADNHLAGKRARANPNGLFGLGVKTLISGSPAE